MENNTDNLNLHWYPGHMSKAKKILEENIKLVDIIIEILDARIPLSSKNPDIDDIAKNKKRIIVMNKNDLAESGELDKWINYYSGKGFSVLKAESVRGKGISEIANAAKEIMKEKIEAQKKRGRIFVPIRLMIAGIPNSGKSTFINKFVKKDVAKTADRPGVTRGKQWIRINEQFELLDTPGILWPKIESRDVGINLGITGAISDNTFDIVLLSYELILIMNKKYTRLIKEKYKIDYEETTEPEIILEKIAKARGFIIKGGELDIKRAAVALVDEYRAGKLGKTVLDCNIPDYAF